MALADGRIPFSQSLRRALRSPLLFSVVGLWMLLLAVESIRPCFFLHDDNACWFIGAYVHDFRVLTETGRLAEVNYYQHGGEPFIEQGQTAVLYPPIYLGVVLAKWFSGDLRWAIEWIAAEHLTLGLIGFYFWLRRGGITPVLAVLGGLAWVLNPFVLIVGASWIFTTFIAAWLPWLFWALDDLLARPSARAAIFLSVIAALSFLQGYVQWFACSILFLALYALFQFATRPETRKLAVLYHLAVSVLICAILSLPLLLPMAHAVENSALRANALPMGTVLEASVSPDDLFFPQVCLFHPRLAFRISSAILYCPALLFIPVTVIGLFYLSGEKRQRLVALVFLGLLALAFSTRAYWFLTMVPLFDRFRWPFKVFLLADFFLFSSLVLTVTWWLEKNASRSKRAKIVATTCLVVVLLANVSISLAFHDGNNFSETVLPASSNPLVPGMDPRLGRVVTFADKLPEDRTYHYLSLAYATYYDFPCLGGYNPLVGQKQLEYVLYLDYPNFCAGRITPDFQKQFEARSVRYWIVEPHSSQFAAIESLTGLRLMEAQPDRVVFEDTLAAPLVYAKSAPTVPCSMTYSGNSLLIHLAGVTSPVEVSVGPTDGWWYRLDQGPWLRPIYQDGRLQIDFQPSQQLLEVSYFDPRFWLGLRWSAGLFLPLGVLLSVGYFLPKPR